MCRPPSVAAVSLLSHRSTSDLGSILDTWLAEHADGIACVISDGDIDHGTVRAVSAGRGRVRSLTPELAKGLEFDLVVLIDPERFGHGIEEAIDGGIEGAVDRYVAMARATQQLVILTRRHGSDEARHRGSCR